MNNTLHKVLRYGVVAAAAPGIAAEYPLEGKPETLEWAVFAEGLQGILAAGGRETAAMRLERGDADLIEFYQNDERESDNGLCKRLNFLRFHRKLFSQDAR